ncbi:MAG: methyltransferase domain-containing protein [Bacteroidota bacterium]|nr:methyltransferase domain-containing protein [Bacteroidota bacterium]
MDTVCAQNSVKDQVRAKYDQIACGEADSGFCMAEGAYDEVDGYVGAADLKLGCGLPFEFTGIKPGERVLDLGSGAGMDAFIAMRHTGPAGTVWGVDLSSAMVDRARRNAQEIGAGNVTFLEGDIEAMPFDAASVDVVISNCTLNLVPDKMAAYAEIHRVLRPGGRFVIADVVRSTGASEVLVQQAEAYAGCAAGAMEFKRYLELIRNAGFAEVTTPSVRALDLPQGRDILKSVVICGSRSAKTHAAA